MSSKAASRTDSASSIFTDGDRAALKKRALRHDLIVAGALPTTNELLSGMTFCRDDLHADVIAFIDQWCSQHNKQLEGELIIFSTLARAEPSTENLAKLKSELSIRNGHHEQEFARRVDVWLAYKGEREAQAHVVRRCISAQTGWDDDIVQEVMRLAFAAGITTRHQGAEYESGDGRTVMRFGMQQIARLTIYIDALQDAFTDLQSKRPSTLAELIAFERIDIDSFDEDAVVAKLDAMLAERDGLAIVVVPTLPPTGTSAQKDIRKSWTEIAGKPLPVAQRGDLAQWRRELVARWPHAEEIVDVVLGDLAAREGVRFRPTLLVGEPGSGKSSLARAILETAGLPCQLVNLGGAADSSAMGTSAQWATARESIPLQIVKASKMASVGVIWDEIEKSDPGRNNGNALDGLLGMLEVDQARRYRDPALEVDVDLSMVSHFATANSIESIPAPIRDRFRVLVMPEPGWQHLHVLTRQIIDRIAADRGIDPRWLGGLAEDELDLVRRAWPGGSIRQLTRILTTVIDGRDRIMGRC